MFESSDPNTRRASLYIVYMIPEDNTHISMYIHICLRIKLYELLATVMFTNYKLRN